MANQDIQELDEGYRLRIAEAGLDQALALFPSDVLVAVRTAIHVRESFALLADPEKTISSLAPEADAA